MKLWAIIRREYLERVRTKGFVIGTILLPALMSLTFLIPMMVEDRMQDSWTVGVVDSSGELMPQLLTILGNTGSEGVKLEAVESLDALKEGILNEDIHGGLVFNDDFIANPRVEFFSKSVSADIASDVLRSASGRLLRDRRYESAGIPDSLRAYLGAWVEWDILQVAATGETSQRDSDGVMIIAITLIMMLYMMTLLYGQQTLTGVIEEKTSRVVELMLSSVSSSQLMMGKLVGICAAGLTQILVWTGSLYYLSTKGVSLGGITFDSTFLTPMILISFIVFFLLGFLLFSSLYAGVGALCNTIQEAQPFSTPIMMFVIIPMLLLTMVMRAPDSGLSVGLSLVPMFSPILMFIRVCMDTPPFWQIGLSWVLMIGTIFLLLRGAGKLYRVGILMSGSAPSWGSLIKTLKQPD
jgi:ABC-2 type transport system permease protein